MVIAETSQKGVLLQPHEAVAIVQQLICERESGDAEPQVPFGPPSLDNVELRPDGTVVCTSCDVTPAVPEVAILLQAMLSRAPRIPGQLQYLIGRALHEVDAPPFDSIQEFSRALTRHERGDRTAVIRGCLDRFSLGRRYSLMPAASREDRRRNPRLVTELRRELREAERERFERRDVRQLAGDWHRWVRPPALMAGAAAGIALIAAGETMHLDRAPRTITTQAISAPTPILKSTPLPVAAYPVALAGPEGATPRKMKIERVTAPVRKARVTTTKRTTTDRPPRQADARVGSRRGFLGVRAISNTAVAGWRLLGRAFGT
jgi:hypothetical protein